MRQLIIDTDLGFDCDDAGALAFANILHNEGAVSLLAITHSVNRQIGAAAAFSCRKRGYFAPKIYPVISAVLS